MRNKLTPQLLRSGSRPSVRKASLYGGIAAIVGVVVIVAIFASGTPIAFEAETGTLAGCAATTSTTGASDGGAVQFKTCSGVVDTTDPTNLDASGTTIPDTAYLAGTCDVTTSSSCANTIFMSTSGSDTNAGTKAAPVKTLNKAYSLVAEGGTIVLRAGTYHDWYSTSGNASIMTKGLTIQPYPHETVWFDGTDVEQASNWTSDGAGHWYMNWSTPQFCNGHYYDFPYNNQSQTGNLTGTSGTTYTSNTGPCSWWDIYGSSEANYPAAGDPQMAFVNGSQVNEVDTLAGATGGKFYYDWSARRIYISSDPSSHTIELSSRPDMAVFGTSNAQYTVRGIGVRRYASNAYANITDAAIYVGGTHPGNFENDVFYQNAANGLAVSTSDSVVNHVSFASNGYKGMGFYGHDHTTHATDNFLLENSVFNDNNTEHYDLNCSLSCGAAGIKMAAVIGYTIKNNIFENSHDSATGAWCDTDCFNGAFVGNLSKNNSVGYHYEQDDGGIIAGNVFMNNKYGVDVGATNTKVYNNTFINNSTINIRIYDDNRPLITAGIAVANNVVAGASVNDDYFGSGSDTSTESEPSNWFTTFDYDSYWRPTNFVLYRMIGAVDNHYNSQASYSTAYPSFEQHAQDIVGATDPFFTDLAGGDYTIRSSSVAYHSGAAIPSDVAAALGTTTAAGQTRGALTWPGK